ncbi:type II secretion system F family protein [Lacipirellula limnantheis]|uniref:Type II secretion system protein F n=1 Tax=Lacipirellula limnantheis TaxID=2528024 RepID=A0A517U3L5_9BACT|nr:type II secretion system F family protein [Lacipirellula limnantheis]QDT75218.1 Type II secretion system protein F [Lacipirellula limnantheis]
MPRFHYQALNAEQELTIGEVEADAVALAITQLEANGLTVLSIGFATAETTAALMAQKQPLPTPRRKPPVIDAAQDESVLRSHLARTLERARPLTPALRAYAEEMPTGRRRRELAEVCGILARGDVEAATAALATMPEYWIPLIGSTARDNDSAAILRDFIAESQQADETRRQWWTLLAYPLFLIGFATLVLVLLAYMVVPTFQSIFEDFDLELPRLTMWTINVSDWITTGAPILLVAILLIAVAAAIKFGGPMLGEWFGNWFGRSTGVARFAASTADLLAGGIETPDALRIASRTAKGGPLRQASQRLAALLQSGDVAAAEQWRRPVTATVFYAVTAELPLDSRTQLLQEIANCYVDHARSRVSWSQGILGPLTIFIVGFVVAFVALSLFLPLINLINNLSG